jgi:hypothetical protein
LAQRAELIAKQKAAYEAAHSETRNGASGRGRAPSTNRRTGERNGSEWADRHGAQMLACARKGQTTIGALTEAEKPRSRGGISDRKQA